MNEVNKYSTVNEARWYRLSQRPLLAPGLSGISKGFLFKNEG